MKKTISLSLAICLLLLSFTLPAAAAARGDVTGDGQVTAEDARLCLRQAVGLEAYKEGDEAFAACDVTGDGQVTAEDARMILRAAVGLENLDQPAAIPEDNEFNILRSGTFFITGTMDADGASQPLVLAVTSDSVYMETIMEGATLAILQRGKKTYMLYPEKKIYMELSAAVLSMMGMTTDDLVDLSTLGFTDMKPLSEAQSVAPGTFRGRSCTTYTFTEGDDSQFVVYMDGAKLLGFTEITPGGATSATTTVDSVTGDVPSDKSNLPKGYRRVLMVTFMKELADILG